ncbi:MAG: hypothetical protein IPJ77_22980 [Planctomycetes bacterium]|nr:hypothetical protein [Planctomycetota bacterium]
MADSADARRISVLGALQAALSRPAVWGSVWAVEFALAAIPATIWFGWLQSTVDHRYAPDELFGDLGTVFRFDQRAELGQLESSAALASAVLALLFMALGAFAAGGWLTLFLSGTRERGLRPFLAGGARFFGRFARVWVGTLLLLAFVSWLARGAPWNHAVLGGLLGVPSSDFERLETLSSEETVFFVRGAQAVVHALLVALVLAWGDFTRTRLALFDGRSALWAGLASAAMLARHPLRSLAPGAGLFLFEVAVVTLLGWLAHRIEARIGGVGEVAVLLVLGQLVLAWRIVLRGARYHAAVAVTHALARPPAKPDPWRFGLLPPR